MTDPDDMLKACERGDINKVRQLLEADSTLINAKGELGGNERTQGDGGVFDCAWR